MRHYAVFVAILAVLCSHVADCYNWHSRNDHGQWYHHGGKVSSESSSFDNSESSEEPYYGGQNRKHWQNHGHDSRYTSGHRDDWRPPNFHPHGFNTLNLKPEFNGNRFNRQTGTNIRACIRSCPVTSEYNPVCGTDNVTYNNIGRLNCAKRCGVAVEMLRKNKCTLTSNIPTPSTSSPNGNNIASTSPVPPNIQQCISLCPQIKEMRPVCGSDGVTYRNPSAILCAQMCGLDVKAAKLSACSVQNPSLPQPLSPSISTCIKTCPATSEYNPVCGSDGVTYQNPSYLQCIRSCGVNIEIRRRAPCPSTGINENVQPTDNVPPSERPTAPSEPQLSLAVQYCIKSCTTSTEYNPICGTNSVTYNNPSSLQCVQKCGVMVEILYRRPCSSPVLPDNINDIPLPISTSEPPRKPTIVECLASCPQSEVYKPICGTNNFTFNNADHLLCAQLCGIDVQIQNEGKCINNEGTTNVPFTSITQETTTTLKPLAPITDKENLEPFTVSIDLINSIFTQPTTKDPTEDIDERLGDN